MVPASAQPTAAERREQGAGRGQARGGGASGGELSAGGSKSSSDSRGAATPRTTLRAAVCAGIIGVMHVAINTQPPDGASGPLPVWGTSGAQQHATDGDTRRSCPT